MTRIILFIFLPLSQHSQSQRILWLLCELFPNEPIPPTSYNVVVHSRQVKGKELHRSPDELKQVHPMGKSPTLVTPSGRVIIESSAIAKYLIDNYDREGKFKGDGNASLYHDDIRDEMISSFANSSIMSIAGIEMLFDMLTKQTPFFIRPMPRLMRYGVRNFFTQPELKKMWKYLDSELEGREYFLGSKLSRSDFMLSWPADFCVQRGYVNLEEKDEKGELKYPRVKAWRERILESKGWKEALVKGGGAGEYDLRTF